MDILLSVQGVFEQKWNAFGFFSLVRFLYGPFLYFPIAFKFITRRIEKAKCSGCGCWSRSAKAGIKEEEER